MYTKDPKPKIAAILIILTVFAAHAAAVTVSVDAPEYVSGNRFDVEIEIDDVDDLDSGQFDISFNLSVVNVTDLDDDIEDGEIGDTAVPIENCYFMNANTIRLLFNFPGVSGIGGSGTLATIRFEVVGGSGDSSFMDISNGLLVDMESEVIPADWVGSIVTLGSQPDGSSGADTVETHTVTAYVKNIDDDKLDVHLLIDGNDEGFESVSSDRTKEYDDYDLDEGAHTFMIRWFDPDTDEWYEKTEEHTITDVTTIVLLTDEHDEDEDKLSAQVYVNNLDDDNLDVYLYIDDEYRKYKSISSGSVGDYDEYEFEEDEDELHAFKIEWFDPGTGEDYEKISRIYITSEEAVTLYIDKHTEEDIILLPAETPTTVSTHPTPTQTSTRPIKESQPTPSTAHVSPTPSGDPAGGSNISHGITPAYTLVGLIAVMFALIQIRRI
jgi:hypothetical protein